MKLRKIGLILALMALMIICGVLVEAEPQIFPPIPVPPKTTPTPPAPPAPPIPTAPKIPIPPPPPPPPPTSSTSAPILPPPPTSSTSAPILPPPSTSSTSAPILPPPSSSNTTPTPTPTPTSSSPQASTPSPPTDVCKSNDACPDPKTFCDLPSGKCQSKGSIGDSCSNDNECLDPFICNGNSCQYSDVGTANNRNNNYNVKKVAIIGAIVIGASAFCGLVFFVYRTFKKKRDYEITSRLYSTDDEMSEPDPYPFNERTNSFSSNTAQSPRIPPKIHFDNLLPTRSRGFASPHQGYNNYYNEYNNEGRYNVRQNENGASRAMNRLQQTRGNVVITQPQNYNNWNPSAIPPQQSGGLFPIPAVNGKYGVPPVPPVPPIPNNLNFNNNNNSYNNLVDNNSNHNQSSKTSSCYSVDHSNSNHNNNHQAKSSRRDSNTLSPDNVNSGKKKGHRNSGTMNSSTYSESIIDYYDRDSIFAKAIENKLPIFRRNKNINNPDEPVPEKKKTSRSTTPKTQTFGYTFDPKLLQSSESEGIDESKKIV